MGVVAETCQTLAVMYAGRVIETGPIAEVLTQPFHPYTMGLRNAFPTISDERRQLISIPGNLPNLIDPPAGCRFAARCPFSTEHCRRTDPSLVQVGEGHFSACHYPEQAVAFRARAEARQTWNQVDPAIAAAVPGGTE
jgi:peptide/nickel transport system ATP-binding protein